MRSIVSDDTRRAFGCGQNTQVLPPAIIEMPLLMIVSLGFVTGVITAMTPYGARSSSVRPWSPVHATGSRSSVPGVRSVTRRFFNTLSSARPSPVSSTATSESSCRLAMSVSRIEAITRPRTSSGVSRHAANARRAPATASSSEVWIPSGFAAFGSLGSRSSFSSTSATIAPIRAGSRLIGSPLDRGVLQVHVAPVLLHRVDDAADDVVHGAVLRHLGEARRGAGRDEHDLALARADGVHGHDLVAGRLERRVDLAGEQELQPGEPGVLARAHHGAQHLGEDHLLAAAASCRRIGSASSSWPCGRGITCTDTTSPTLAAAAAPASVAARTAATSPRTTVVT